MQTKRRSANLRALRVLTVLAPILFATSPAPADDGSLCDTGETAWFAAKVKGTGERVSVCGAPMANGVVTWLQFRMGTPVKLTLAWPEERKRSLRSFNYRRYTRYRVSLLKLDFRIGDRDYALLEDDVSEDKPQYSLTLRIRDADTETDIANHELEPVTERLSLLRFERIIEAKPYNE